MIPLTFLLVILSICLRNFTLGEYQHSLTLADILPEDSKHYDKMRPPKKDGQATTVLFHVTVMGLDSIDETSMTFAADIFFAQSWKDHRLRLPENMTTDYRLLQVEWLKDMWRPDSFFKNAKSVTFQTMTIPNHYMWLYADKTILYMVKLTLKLSCAMNFAIYPHDTQECKLQMESLSYETEAMDYKWDFFHPLVVEEENIQLSRLQLIETKTDYCIQSFASKERPFVEVVFTFKRRLGHYIFHTYIPSCMIVIVSWISFWIKPEVAPARITLGVTSILTIYTSNAKSRAVLSPVSYLKAVDAFMSICAIFVFIALIELYLVNMVLGDALPKPSTRSSSESIKPSELPTREYNKKQKNIGKIEIISNLLASPKVESGRNGTKSDTDPVMPKLTSAQRRSLLAINIDRFPRIFFPFCFGVLNLAYWITFYEYH